MVLIKHAFSGINEIKNPKSPSQPKCTRTHTTQKKQSVCVCVYKHNPIRA